MAHFAISRADGSLAIMQTFGKASVGECILKWTEEERAKVRSVEEIDPATVPVDRTYRTAWTLDGKAIAHDMAKAREIQRERLRAERAPVLAALDLAYLRADESKDDAVKTDVASRKQALRDVTDNPAIELASSIDELKSLTLDKLTK